MDLTDKQLEIYEVIKDFIDKNGYSPSIRDICKASGRNSPSTVHTHLKAIREKGYINYIDGIRRTIVVLK